MISRNLWKISAGRIEPVTLPRCFTPFIYGNAAVIVTLGEKSGCLFVVNQITSNK